MSRPALVSPHGEHRLAACTCSTCESCGQGGAQQRDSEGQSHHLATPPSQPKGRCSCLRGPRRMPYHCCLEHSPCTSAVSVQPFRSHVLLSVQHAPVYAALRPAACRCSAPVLPAVGCSKCGPQPQGQQHSDHRSALVHLQRVPAAALCLRRRMLCSLSCCVLGVCDR